MRKMMKTMGLAVALLVCLCMIAQATALSANRDTPTRSLEKLAIGVYTGSVIYAGALVAVNSSGYAVAASDAASIQVIGCAAEKVDETGKASGTDNITILMGTFRYKNGDTVTDANIGDICYVVDDQTVSVTNSGSNAAIAGIVADVDSDGVWVLTRHIDRTAGSFTTLAASGAATLSSTLAVSSGATLSSTLGVNGVSSLHGTTIAGNATVTTNLTVSGTANIAGATTLSNTLAVAGASTITGAGTFAAGVNVAGASTYSNSITLVGSVYTATGTVTAASYIAKQSGGVYTGLAAVYTQAVWIATDTAVTNVYAGGLLISHTP